MYYNRCMKLLFQEGNYYSQSILKDGFKSEETLFKNIHNKTHFTYAKVPYEQFCKNYQAEGWIERKLTALPMAIWAATAKVVYHLGHMVFSGFPKLFFDHGKTIRTYAFFIIRDYQEAYARVATLFDDTFGLYHLHESAFHKECYEYHLNPVNDYREQVVDHVEKKYPAATQSEHQFDKMTEGEFHQIQPYLKSEHYAFIPTSKYPLLDFDTLHTDCINSFFSDPAKLSQVPEEAFIKIAHKLDKKVIASVPDNRLNLINYNKINIDQFSALFPADFRMGTTEIKLSKLTPENFNILVNNFFMPQYFRNLPDNHLNTIDYNKLSKSSIEMILSLDKQDGVSRIKLEKLNPANFKIILKHIHNYEVIPACHINDIDYIRTPNVQLNLLFSVKADLLSDKTTQTRDKLQKLSSDNFRHIFHFLKLNELYLMIIPDNHIPEIPTEQLSKQLVQIFLTTYPLGTPAKERFALLSGNQVACLFDHLTKEQIKWIDEKQLKDPLLKMKYDAFFASNWRYVDRDLDYWKNLYNGWYNQFNSLYNWVSSFWSSSNVPKLEGPNPYEALQLTEANSVDEIKEAYKRLSLTHHPDKGGDKDEFQRITAAYEVLKQKLKFT